MHRREQHSEISPDRPVDRLLTPRAVAERFACTERHLRNLRAAGKLPAPVLLGASVRWRESDIDRFIECGCDMAKFNAAATVVG